MSQHPSTLISSNTVRSPSKHDQSNPSSPLTKFFLTSGTTSEKQLYGEAYALVMQLHKDLTNMVDSIGVKVAETIDRSESEFLIAYRNHMKKIRTELEEMKHKLQIHQNETSVEKVNILEKQLRFFRQESLKMYDKLEAKNRQCEQLTSKLKQTREQNVFLQGEVKKLMKYNKLLEIQKNNISKSLVQNISIDHSFMNATQDHFPKSRATHRPNSYSKMYSTKYQPQIKQICKDRQVESQVNRLVGTIVREKNTTISRLQSRWKQNQQSTTDLRTQNELETFFLDCVESVRKDLYKKKNKIGTERWSIIDFEMFKTLDRIQIMSLFVNNEIVLREIYNQVFGKEEIGKPRYYNRLQIRTSKRQNRAASTYLN